MSTVTYDFIDHLMHTEYCLSEQSRAIYVRDREIDWDRPTPERLAYLNAWTQSASLNLLEACYVVSASRKVQP